MSSSDRLPFEPAGRMCQTNKKRGKKEENNIAVACLVGNDPLGRSIGLERAQVPAVDADYPAARAAANACNAWYLFDTVDGRNPAPLENPGKPLFVGIYMGILIPGLLRWCRISSPASPGDLGRTLGFCPGVGHCRVSCWFP